ncbi:hypothetical protein [Streptomyces sp. H27-C3]|uniref:hypothetical protein n=1 Tax=Streptomyces sp. H27-C3 TaxID=3046305 RepID=UPI0032D9337A
MNDSGIPSARVRELLLLQSGEEEFASAVADIDKRLRAEIRERQRHRERIARLASGGNLALPAEVVEFLDRLRALGVDAHWHHPVRCCRSQGGVRPVPDLGSMCVSGLQARSQGSELLKFMPPSAVIGCGCQARLIGCPASERAAATGVAYGSATEEVLACGHAW